MQGLLQLAAPVLTVQSTKLVVCDFAVSSGEIRRYYETASGRRYCFCVED